MIQPKISNLFILSCLFLFIFKAIKFLVYHFQQNFQIAAMSNPSFIDQMTNTLIRPARDTYPNEQLGPKQFIVKNKNNKSSQKPKQLYIEVNRHDSVVECKEGKIMMSYFQPKKREGDRQINKAVIYLHANSGSRVQGVELAKYVLPLGWNLALFDYRGSGNSSGQYSSMGIFESQDLVQVINYLQEKEGVREVSLWGRSMGAVTIVYFFLNCYRKVLSKGMKVKDVVLDSPFGDLRRLMQELGGRSFNLPEFVFNPLIGSINQRVISKIGVDLLSELTLLNKLSSLRKNDPQLWRLLSEIGGLLLTSKEDKMVSCAHVEELYKVLPLEPRQLVYYQGQHNDIRSDSIKWQCAYFLCSQRSRTSSKKPSLEVKETYPIHGLGPHKKQDNKKAENTKSRPPQLNFGDSKHHFLVHPQHKKGQLISPKNIKENDKNEQDPNASKKTRKNSLKGNLDLRQYVSDKRIQYQQPDKVKQPRPSLEPQPSFYPPPPLLSPTQIQQPPQQFSPPQQYQLTQPPTIIINHNYNVSVNVIGSPHNIQHQTIPPINFNAANNPSQGFKTQRMPEGTTMPKKYFIPHTTKVEKNKDSFIATKKTYNIPPKSPGHRAEHKNLVSSFSFVPHAAQNPSWNGNSSAYIQHLDHAKKQSNIIDIPPINFDNLSYDSHCSSEIHSSQGGIDSTQQETFGSLIVNNNKKEKVSLSELRKHQKQQQNSCVMKSSKVLTFKDKPNQADFYKLDLKKQAKQMQDKWKYRSFDGPEDRKMMKTSLMARKKNQRKNSDANSNGTSSVMKSHILKIQPQVNNKISIFDMGREQVKSPKEFKKDQF